MKLAFDGDGRLGYRTSEDRDSNSYDLMVHVAELAQVDPLVEIGYREMTIARWLGKEGEALVQEERQYSQLSPKQEAELRDVMLKLQRFHKGLRDLVEHLNDPIGAKRTTAAKRKPVAKKAPAKRKQAPKRTIASKRRSRA